MKRWEELPEFMRVDEVRPYYDALSKRKVSLVMKRAFDIVVSLILLIVALIPMVIIGLIVGLESRGGIFYRQERVTTYGKVFRIHKFRTMVAGADKIGSAVTVSNDARVTRSGQFLRKYRLDELPQLIDILEGNMSFVGTRPEVVKYVDLYTNEMKATLLLPAGVTSEASIRYKDEAELLDAADDVDKVYMEKVLPQKMIYNLQTVRNFSFLAEIRTMFRTVAAVLGKEYT